MNQSNQLNNNEVSKLPTKSIIFVKAVILFALFLVLIGLFSSGYEIYRLLRFRLQGTKVEAIIEKCHKQKISIRYSMKGLERWRLQYTGIYGFDIINTSGNKMHFTGKFSIITEFYYDWEVNPREYKVGSTLQVMCLPSNPQSSMPLNELTNSNLTVLPGIFIVLLIIALGLYAIYYFFYKGKKPPIQKMKG